jgi:hypothetical protein
MLAVSSSRPGNRLLAALSAADLDLLQPHLQPVPLKLRLDLEQPNRRIDAVMPSFPSGAGQGQRVPQGAPMTLEQITEGDARTLVGLSQVKSIYQQSLTGDLVKRLMRMGAPLSKEAWERTGKHPGPEAFMDKKAIEEREKPRISATASAMPVAADRKFWCVRPSICTR